MAYSAGMIGFKTAYQTSPIVLTGGIAQFMPGGVLPLLALTQGLSFTLGLLAGGNVGVDDYFANFEPLPGSSLIRQKVGVYPFANLAVAGNATITEPLNISLLMTVPASAAGGYLTKSAIMSALQATLAQHNAAGGTFAVATPAYYYTTCILTDLRDVTPAQSKQVQMAYQWDFYIPLLTLESLLSVQNSLLNAITNGLPLQSQDGSAFSSLATVGSPPSGATAAISPATAGTPAALASPASAGPPS